MFVGCGAHKLLWGLRFTHFVGSWVRKVYGALGSKSLWGVGRINCLRPWVHKVCGALGPSRFVGLRLIKFVGSWVRKKFGALGSQNPGTKKQESISGEPFILPCCTWEFFTWDVSAFFWQILSLQSFLEELSLQNCLVESRELLFWYFSNEVVRRESFGRDWLDFFFGRDIFWDLGGSGRTWGDLGGEIVLFIFCWERNWQEKIADFFYCKDFLEKNCLLWQLYGRRFTVWKFTSKNQDK